MQTIAIDFNNLIYELKTAKKSPSKTNFENSQRLNVQQPEQRKQVVAHVFHETFEF